MSVLRGVLAPKDLDELAFQLLTSSTIERYERKLRESKAIRQLADQLYQEPSLGTEWLRYAQSLWQDLRNSRARSEHETILAPLLFILANSAVPGVNALLLQCSLDTGAHTSWISGLARRVLRSRRTTQAEVLQSATASVSARGGRAVATRSDRAIASSSFRWGASVIGTGRDRSQRDIDLRAA